MQEATHDIGIAAEEIAGSTARDFEQPEEADGIPSRRSSSLARLYAVVWRWHFYAGLITAPILWLVTITGALYVFRTELSSWRDRAWLEVRPGAERLGYEALRKIATRAFGKDDLDAVLVHAEPDRSVRFTADAEGPGAEGAEHRHHHVYINPYTGDVLGSRIEEEDFFAVILELHRSLFLGRAGRILTELATGWAIVLFATGIYLWWPRGKPNVGVWAPRVRGKLYAVLRDWHAVIGAYLAPLTALVAVTGLFFTIIWGTGFNTTVQKAGHWPPEWFGAPKSAPRAADARPAPLDRVVETVLAQSRPGDGAAIRLGLKPDDAYKAWLMRDEDKNSLRMVNVDQYTARQLEVLDAVDVPFLYRVRLWAVSIHMGQIFGVASKVLALVASLIVLGLSITGVWMWWHRRPRGRAGFPRRQPAGTLPRWGWLVVASAGILMPVVGASMVLIVLIDMLVTSLPAKSRA